MDGKWEMVSAGERIEMVAENGVFRHVGGVAGELPPKWFSIVAISGNPDSRRLFILFSGVNQGRLRDPKRYNLPFLFEVNDDWTELVAIGSEEHQLDLKFVKVG
ncbi:hypothetical protein D9M69_718280 [compost metagenome]